MDALRAADLDDRAIVDANQVVAYFNYVNRIADGLGVELEATWPEQVRREERRYPRSSVLPAVAAEAVPWLSVAEMREVDRLMVEEFAIGLLQMMENAGRSLALLTRLLLGGSVRGTRIAILAGPGGNGGGGIAAARHLAAGGSEVSVHLSTQPEQLAAATAQQHRALLAAGIPASGEPPLDAVDLVLDAVLGYGQRGAPAGEAAELIRWSRGRRVLALDVPSGLELETGTLHEPHVSAEATMTLALPKRSLDHKQPATGQLYLADIGVPARLYEHLGLQVASPFLEGPLVKLLSR